MVAVGLLVTGAMVVRDREPTVAAAAPALKPLATLVRAGNTAAPLPLRGEAARAAVASIAHTDERPASDAGASHGDATSLNRWHRVYRLSGHYGVTPELAMAIHDIALAEGIEPDLAFRLVRAESEFNTHATSRVGAVGLTQVMPGTARYFVNGKVTKQRLYDPHLNLHVGFRYLRGLIRQYKSLRVALLVYNRGPVAVDAALDRGDDPANGYDEMVAKGYRGPGTVGR